MTTSVGTIFLAMLISFVKSTGAPVPVDDGAANRSLPPAVVPASFTGSGAGAELFERRTDGWHITKEGRPKTSICVGAARKGCDRTSVKQ